MLNTLTAEEMNTGAPLSKAGAEERRRMSAWLDERLTAAKKKPSAEVVTLTPMLASLLLERNPINRPISPRNANNIASDIANGRFEFNGESIVISKSGVLIDGQHRCLQVVATGKPIETVIVFGPADAARFTIDTGKVKSAANFLAMKEFKYSQSHAAAVGYYLQWRSTGRIETSGKGTVPTTAEKVTAADELKGMDTSVEFTHPAIYTIGSHAIVAFCHYVFWKRSSRESADHFIGKMIDGDGLRKGDPILYCRNRLIGVGRGVAANSKIELIFKCWNAHRSGAGIDSHLKMSGIGKLPKLER